MALYSADVFENYDISEEEVSIFLDTHIGCYQIDTTRISKFLLIQLAAFDKHGIYNVFSITDVIRELEGIGRGYKKKVDQFKHSPLKGFWKAHFTDARFIYKNIINNWGLENENNDKFNNLCNHVIEEEEKSPSTGGWQGRLAHAFVIGGYEERARKNKLTGEWIIFSKYNNKNYYLCISAHTSKEEDQNLYDFLKILCEHEYPFLLSENAI